MKLFDEDQQDLDEYLHEILERRKLEKAAEAVGDDFTSEDAEVDAEVEPEEPEESEGD
jgi:DNA-directed RNA polymerase subunit beta'